MLHANKLVLLMAMATAISCSNSSGDGPPIPTASGGIPSVDTGGALRTGGSNIDQTGGSLQGDGGQQNAGGTTEPDGGPAAGGNDGGAGNTCDCSGRGSCENGDCACDRGYTGESCDLCDDGFRKNALGTLCISSFCDTDPCTGDGSICDSATDSCCSMTCEIGTRACEAGFQETCVETTQGCSQWSAPKACLEGGCLCPYGSDGIEVQQWGTSAVETNSIGINVNGEILIAGSLFGPLPGQTRAGRMDMYILAQTLTSSGAEELWNMQWGSDGTDLAYGMALTPSGGVLIAGSTSGQYGASSTFGVQDGSVTKWSAEGILEWHDQWGTTRWDSAQAVAVGQDGAVYVGGNTRGDLDDKTAASAGQEDIVVRKLSATGVPLWTRQWGGIGRDYATAVATGEAGELWAAGALDSAAFCQQLDPNDGTVLWTYTLDAPEFAQVTALVAIPDGPDQDDGSDGVIVAGFLTGWGAHVARLDMTGTVVWEDFFGVNGSGSALGATMGPNGDIYLVGNTPGSLVPGAHVGKNDIFIQKRLVNDGAIVWTKQVGSPEPERGNDIAVAADGTVYVTGISAGSFPGYDSVGNTAVLIKIPQ